MSSLFGTHFDHEINLPTDEKWRPFVQVVGYIRRSSKQSILGKKYDRPKKRFSFGLQRPFSIPLFSGKAHRIGIFFRGVRGN